MTANYKTRLATIACGRVDGRMAGHDSLQRFQKAHAKHIPHERALLSKLPAKGRNLEKKGVYFPVKKNQREREIQRNFV